MHRTRTLCRRSVLAGLAAGGAFALGGCSSFGSRTYSFAFSGLSADDTLAAVNAARREGGQGPMRIDSKAQKAAERHARAMAKAARMAHELPGGPRFPARMERDGIRTLAAENVAWGQRDVGGAVTAWMNSPGHRRNMLDTRFDGVGVASAEGKDGRLYWAMILVP